MPRWPQSQIGIMTLCSGEPFDYQSQLEDLSIQVLVRDEYGKLIFGGEGSVGIVKPDTESFAEILLWDVEVPPSSSVELVSELGF